MRFFVWWARSTCSLVADLPFSGRITLKIKTCSQFFLRESQLTRWPHFANPCPRVIVCLCFSGETIFSDFSFSITFWLKLHYQILFYLDTVSFQVFTWNQLTINTIGSQLSIIQYSKILLHLKLWAYFQRTIVET